MLGQADRSFAADFTNPSNHILAFCGLRISTSLDAPKSAYNAEPRLKRCGAMSARA